ncbi:MAG: signal transduction protein [Methanoculleus sp. SDB]|nr:MAG: signal transduction protein [Methanoculleus sp. SDB]
MSEELLIRDVMVKPLTISKSAAITEALDKMLDEGADPLIVTNNGGVMGTISRKAIAETLGSRKSSVVAPAKIHVANKTDEDYTVAYPDQHADILVPLLQEYRIVVVLDNEHRLVGQVGPIDLLRVMRPDTVAEHVMQTAFTIRSDERVVHLRRRMIDENISKFIVMDDGEMQGIVTETDVAKAMKAFREIVEDKYQDHRIRNLLVKDIMTAPAITVDVDEDITAITDLIVKKSISSLPVTNNGKLVGLLTKQALISAL